jgi:hypothetical protein
MSTVSAPAAHWRVVWRRRVAKWARWLHIYSSMASFAIVFFFAATGITLNHAEWFVDPQRASQSKGSIDRGLLKTTDGGVAKPAIVEYLTRTHHLSGALADFRVDDQQCALSFKGPGYSADVFIDRATGRYDLTEARLGVVAVLNDLHKGRDTGVPWRFAIDVSAGLLVFIAMSGLVLLYFVHKHRVAGALALAAGAVLVYGVYRVFVP